jgi:hypothetical protein
MTHEQITELNELQWKIRQLRKQLIGWEFDRVLTLQEITEYLMTEYNKPILKQIEDIKQQIQQL